MNTSDAPASQPDLAAISAALDRYRPTTLTAAQADEALPRLVASVKLLQHKTPMAAKGVMASACRFLADVAPHDGCDLDALLTDVNVSRWSHQWKASDQPTGTLAIHLARLNRLLRVRGGLPEKVTAKEAGTAEMAPYPLHELQHLVEGLATDDPRAAAVIAAGAGVGIVGQGVVDGSFAVYGGRPAFATADGEHLPVVECWHRLAAALQSVTVDEGAWGRARAAAAMTSGPLEARRLRRTATAAALAEAKPVATILRETGLGTKTVDKVLAYLEMPLEQVVDDLLRG